eukprot:15484409-Alexandrium_andersonii.AAC.1
MQLSPEACPACSFKAQPRARACASRRARHATGTQGGAWECSRHAVSTRILGMQPETRVFGTSALGK